MVLEPAKKSRCIAEGAGARDAAGRRGAGRPAPSSGGISCPRPRERIERAKQEWKDGTFGLIPGDDKEFIPLPEDR